MAAENPEITESNHEHFLSDLHECAKILHRINRLLDNLEAEKTLTALQPLLAQFRSPAAAYMTRRASRRNGNE